MSKSKISPEQENEIINSYNSGLSMYNVGKIFNINAATVLRILNKYNVQKRTKGGIYKLPEEEIISRYKNGESCQTIADDFKVSFNSISGILRKYNIPRDNRYYNLTLNEDYFEEINSYDKAYFLGFMLTDGNISKNENIIRLALSVKDEHILETFKNKTGNSNKIIKRIDDKHDERIFQLRSTKWKTDLAKYGVIPCKTSVSEMPTNIKEEFMSHLIRGMIDGDGWISATDKYQSIGFCGNEKTVTQLHDYFVEKIGVFNVKILHPEEHLWQCSWSGKNDLKKIGAYIYQNKNDCYLIRKYNNYLKATQDDTEVIS